MVTLALFPILHSVTPWLGIPLQYSIKWMNDSVTWIYSLPLGRIQGWWPTPWDVFLLTMISLLVGYLHFQKTRFSFLVFLLTCIVFFGSMIVEEKLDQNRIEIVAGGTGENKFVWVKDKLNTILYSLNGDTLKPPLNYLQRYNQPPDQVIHFNPFLSAYSSGPLNLEGNTIRYKDQLYQIISGDRDTLVHPEKPGRIILLTNEWKAPRHYPGPLAIYIPDFILTHEIGNHPAVRWHRSSFPYVIIRLK
jgi:hypothetical protein